MKKTFFLLLILILFLSTIYLISTNRVEKRVSKNILSISPSADISHTSEKIGQPPSIPFKLPSGFSVGVFSDQTEGARDLQMSPEGILLVSIPSEGKIVALPDQNNDGIADESKTVVDGLYNPHGLAFYKDKLFIAEETRVARYSWNAQSMQALEEKELFKLPQGGRHNTRTIEFSKNGEMFVSIGSTCDTCFEKDPWISTVIISNENGDNQHVYAKGLRNAVFIKTNPTTGQLWGVEMGRDYLGDNTPPDEINIIENGKNYGWPVCYGKNIHDNTFDKSHKSSCDADEPSLYDIQAHSAPLGLNFIPSGQFPSDWTGDLLVAYHGSWNRSVPTGYKIVHMKVQENKIVGEKDFMTGFIQGSSVEGRPVDVEFDKNGSLYVSDDKAGAIYKVIYSNK